MNNADVKNSCDITQFTAWQYCGPQAKTYVVQGLSKNYHLQLDLKLLYGTCDKRQKNCACMECTNMLDNIWYPGIPHTKQP